MGRPVQFLCPLEIRSTMTQEELNKRIAIANNKSILRLKRQDQEDWQKRKHARTFQELQKTKNDFKYSNLKGNKIKTLY